MILKKKRQHKSLKLMMGEDVTGSCRTRILDCREYVNRRSKPKFHQPQKLSITSHDWESPYDRVHFNRRRQISYCRSYRTFRPRRSVTGTLSSTAAELVPVISRSEFQSGKYGKQPVRYLLHQPLQNPS